MRKDEGERMMDESIIRHQRTGHPPRISKGSGKLKRLCKSHRSVDSEIVNDLAIEANLARHSQGDSRISFRRSPDALIHPSSIRLHPLSFAIGQIEVNAVKRSAGSTGRLIAS